MRGIITAAIVSVIGAGFSAHAGIASLDQQKPPAPLPAKPTGYEADDHFPGALYFEVAAQDDLPTPGATGTTDLPDMPVPENAILDSSIHAARPFHLAGTATDRARALQCLTTAIYYEAAREPDDGQRAVAQVILNRVDHPAFPDTICGVVYQGSEHAGCQFSFACDGSMARRPMQQWWDRAEKVARAALDGSVFAPVGLATHYHTYQVRPAWNRSLVMTGVFGAHFFHRWKGWWGTPAAFNQTYRGHEPVPGPHPRVDLMVQTPTATPVQVAAVQPQDKPHPTPPGTEPTQIRSRYSDSGAPLAAPKADVTHPSDNLPESQILDKWKDSGKPLR